jgi:hypothetical protein
VIRFDPGYLAAGDHPHMPFVQQVRGRCRNLLLQRRKDPGRAFEERDSHVRVRIEPPETVIAEHLARFAQFGSQFHAGGAAPDDHDVNARGRLGLLLQVGHRHDLQHAQPEALGVLRPVQGQGMLGRPRNAEVVGRAADGNDQRGIRHLPLRDDHVAPLAQHCTHRQGPGRRVESQHRPEDEVKAVVVCQHQVRQALLMDIERPGCDLMQRRLPDVKEAAVHEGHTPGAQLAPQLAGQLQPACPATHDHYVVQLGLPMVDPGAPATEAETYTP